MNASTRRATPGSPCLTLEHLRDVAKEAVQGPPPDRIEEYRHFLKCEACLEMFIKLRETLRTPPVPE